MGNPDKAQLKGKFRKKFSIFLLCLFLSTFMWLFIKLTRDYTLDFRFSITYKNFPKHLVLSEVPDSLLTIGLNAKGFKLLASRYLHRKLSLQVDCKDGRIRHNANGYYMRFVVSRLMPQLNKQLPSSHNITFISPDSITLHFTDASHKKVPVMLRLVTSFRKQYQLYDRIKLSPDSVIVTASPSVLDTLRFVESEAITKKNLDENQKFPLRLKVPLNPGQMRISEDSVQVFIPVGKYTEADFIVPIEVKVASKQTHIKTFPDKCTVTCMVPVKDYRHVNAGMFSASAAFSPGLIKTSKLKVSLTQWPQRIKILKITPAEVEFIILKK